jgi:2-phospho-L-lactate guanylyltransferase
VIPVVIPAKPLDRALSRLSGVLSPTERRAIQAAMLTDVIRAGAGMSDRVVVVSADRQVAAIADGLGARVVADATPAQGIDVAVRRGLEAVDGDEALVVMGDLPLVTSEDLHALSVCLGGDDEGIACATSADGTGTNAIHLRPPEVIATSFGIGSLARHRAAAERLDVPAIAVALPGLMLDIDTPQDLTALMRSGHECATVRVCAGLGIADPLAAAAAK